MAERTVGRPWNTHEDNLLKQAVAIHGENDNWKTISLSVPGRTNKACRKVSMSDLLTSFASIFICDNLAMAPLAIAHRQKICMDSRGRPALAGATRYPHEMVCYCTAYIRQNRRRMFEAIPRGFRPFTEKR